MERLDNEDLSICFFNDIVILLFAKERYGMWLFFRKGN